MKHNKAEVREKDPCIIQYKIHSEMKQAKA